MPRGRLAGFHLVLADVERTELERIVRSPSMPAGLVRRAKIVLRSADGDALRDRHGGRRESALGELLAEAVSGLSTRGYLRRAATRPPPHA